MQESKVLKVSGILLIIGGAMMTLLGLIGFFGGAALSVGSAAAGGLFMVISLLGLVGAVLELVAGIMGVKAWNQPAKAGGCFVMGIILIVLSLMSNLGSIYISGFSASMVLNIVLGLVLPVLYTFGAAQLKQAA